MKIIEYKVNDQALQATVFLPLVNRIWPGDYDRDKTQTALSKTLNITVCDNNVLMGCLRILSDDYYLGTITELLILPEYQKEGIGHQLLHLAKENPCHAVFWRTAGSRGVL